MSHLIKGDAAVPVHVSLLDHRVDVCIANLLAGLAKGVEDTPELILGDLPRAVRQLLVLIGLNNLDTKAILH